MPCPWKSQSSTPRAGAPPKSLLRWRLNLEVFAFQARDASP
jgi:hypothetical protein